MVAQDKRSRSSSRLAYGSSLAVLIVGMAQSNSALADSTDDDRARAEQLFNEGRAAIAAEDYKTACPKFEESLKLARRAGTLFNLAQCDEHEGRLVSAVAYYKEGIVVLEPGDPRLGPSKKQLANVEPRIPFLTIKLDSNLPAGGRVTLDGHEVRELDKEFVIDPGKHEIRVLAPKYADGVLEFEIDEFVHLTKTVSMGARLPEPPIRTTNALTPKRIGMIAAFGVGGLGFVGAAITGELLVSTNARVQEGCPQTVCTTAAGFEASRQGKPLLVANTIAWGMGLAGAGTGVFLLLYKGKKESAAPKSAHSFIFGPGFVGVEGRF